MIAGVIQGCFIGGRPRGATSQARSAHAPGAGAPHTIARAGPPPRPGPPAAAGRSPTVQAFGLNQTTALDPRQVGLQAGGGAPLPDAVRGRMEVAMGADFSDVRVHVGLQAERIGAVAFTFGSDIYFAPGRYQPETATGQQLLGHELAHVIQQRQGRVRNPLGAGVAVVHDRALEAEAERLGRRAASYRTSPMQARMALAAPRPWAPAAMANPSVKRVSPQGVGPTRPVLMAVAQRNGTDWRAGRNAILQRMEQDSGKGKDKKKKKAKKEDKHVKQNQIAAKGVMRIATDQTPHGNMIMNIDSFVSEKFQKKLSDFSQKSPVELSYAVTAVPSKINRINQVLSQAATAYWLLHNPAVPADVLQCDADLLQLLYVETASENLEIREPHVNYTGGMPSNGDMDVAMVASQNWVKRAWWQYAQNPSSSWEKMTGKKRVGVPQFAEIGLGGAFSRIIYDWFNNRYFGTPHYNTVESKGLENAYIFLDQADTWDDTLLNLKFNF